MTFREFCAQQGRTFAEGIGDPAFLDAYDRASGRTGADVAEQYTGGITWTDVAVEPGRAFLRGLSTIQKAFEGGIGIAKYVLPAVGILAALWVVGTFARR